jgi:outer membrane beta-barrel protein
MKNMNSVKMVAAFLTLALGSPAMAAPSVASDAPTVNTAIAEPVPAAGSVIAEPPEPEGPKVAMNSDRAAEPTLDQQLDALQVPTNQAPPGISEEKLYAVQSRFVSLKNRHEFSLGGGRNFNSDSFVSSNNLEVGYRYYLNDRWFLSTSGSYVFNEWSSGAERLIAEAEAANKAGKTPPITNATLADVALARYRADLLAGYHLFYGKFRLSMDQVFYFDQYVALGPGYVDMRLGNQFAAVAEVGLVFWFGRNVSMRMSMKDYFVREVTEKGGSWAHNIIGGLQVGYVFGG